MGAVEDTGEQPRRKGFNPLAALGILVLVTLLVAGGWALWTFVGTSEMTRRAAADELSTLRQQWRAVADERGDEPRLVTEPEVGAAQWMIRIPALGQSQWWPVVVGTDYLDRGVGWYPGAAQPGQVGNFAVSGHQITHGEPFAGWENLHVGHQVMVESIDAVHIYTLITSAGELTVQADEAWVLEPVPGQPDQEPVQAFITLVTHEDLIPTSDRSVVFGVLTSTELK